MTKDHDAIHDDSNLMRNHKRIHLNLYLTCSVFLSNNWLISDSSNQNEFLCFLINKQYALFSIVVNIVNICNHFIYLIL